MGKRFVIAEKPSVARDIAAALGGFEDQGEWLESDDFVVSWAVGHLLSLAEPQDYDAAFKSWSIKNLPILPKQFLLIPKDGQKKRLQALGKLAKRDDVTGLVNACDAGREGELIFRRIVEYDGIDKPIQRLWLQSMTKSAIKEGFEHLRDGRELESLADAAWCRSVGDWMVGMNATRALTQRLKSRNEKGAWSAGRVQTPTLHMLVVREREILAHEPRPYWEIAGTFGHGAQQWEGRYWDPSVKDDEDRDTRPNRVFDEALAKALLAGVQAARTGKADEKRKRSKQNAPLPFDLTSLQREANKRFSYSARRTLDAAQRLYEAHKLITYPRTDSRYLPDDYEAPVRAILGALKSDREYGALADGILAGGPQNLDRILDGKHVSDHFAIIPTETAAGPLPPDDLKVYDLIVRQFLASMMGPATWANVERTVAVPIEGKERLFRTTARSLEIPGFLEALGKEEGAGTWLPPLVEGKDTVEGLGVAVLGATSEEKVTTPPARFSEGTLLRMMETAGENVDDDDLSDAMKDKGLGTPATRAEIIEGLVSKQYARRVDGKLAATSKAMRLMDVLDRVDVPTLASPELTGKWEYDLKQVQLGRLSKGAMYAQLTKFTKDIVKNLVGFEHESLYAGEPPLGACPNCGKGQVVESAWGYPCTRNTEAGADCNFMVWKERAGRYMDRPTVVRLIEKRRVGPVPGFVDRSGRGLEGTLVLSKDPEDGRWRVDVEYGNALESGPESQISVLGPSPVDPDDEIVETNLRYVSRRVLEGKTRNGPVLPKIVCQREISPEEALLYFSPEGKTPFLEGFVSKRGRPFQGLLFRKETGKHGFEFPPREPRPGRKGAAEAPAPEGKGAKGKGTKKAAATGAKGKAPAKGTKKAAGAKAAASKAAGGKAAKAAGAKAAGAKAAGSKAAGGKAAKAAGAKSGAKSAAGKAAGAEAPAPRKPGAKGKAPAKKPAAKGGDAAPAAAPKTIKRKAGAKKKAGGKEAGVEA